MRRVSVATAALAAVMATYVGAQVATPAQSAPPPSLKQIGLIVYPAKGQKPEQQAADEAECTKWAETQTGIKLQAGGVDVQAAGQQAKQATADATTGAAVGGAAKGAAVGAAMGAVTGDAGDGAAIGAIAGAVGGRRAKKSAEAKAEAEGQKQAQNQNAALVNQFKKAAGACLSGRGYTVS
jgi:hypothetical protein